MSLRECEFLFWREYIQLNFFSLLICIFPRCLEIVSHLTYAPFLFFSVSRLGLNTWFLLTHLITGLLTSFLYFPSLYLIVSHNTNSSVMYNPLFKSPTELFFKFKTVFFSFVAFLFIPVCLNYIIKPFFCS